MTKQGTNKIGKVISYIVIVLVLVAVCGLLAYFTNGFTSDFKTFYVECAGEQVLSTSEGFEMAKDEPMTVDVKYTFGAVNKEISGYSVKVVPNAIQGKDFDFTLDGDAYPSKLKMTSLPALKLCRKKLRLRSNLKAVSMK